MIIKIKLFASFRKDRFREKDMELTDGCTVEWVLDYLKIPHKELGILFVNGLSVNVDKVLQAGDTLSIFPMVGGG